MGDRANIAVKQSHGAAKLEYVFIYTHWCGSELPKILQKALIRGRSRWTDNPYLTRIIVSEVIGKSDWDSLTGTGISTYLCDNEYAILVVDCESQTVSVAKEKVSEDSDLDDLFNTVSFEDYVKLSEDELAKFRGDEK